MLRSALALLSSLQIGARIKEAVERSLRQAILIALAVAVLIGAAAFGLIAAYYALISIYQFSPLAAAGLIAVSLLVVGLLILATVPLIGRKRRAAPAPLPSAAEGLGLADQQLGKAMKQVGPITLLAIAFVAGVLASRR